MFLCAKMEAVPRSVHVRLHASASPASSLFCSRRINLDRTVTTPRYENEYNCPVDCLGSPNLDVSSSVVSAQMVEHYLHMDPKQQTR